jgi:hypothetical protein
MADPVFTATFKAPLPAGLRVQVVTDEQGSVLIASVDAATEALAQAALASAFNQVSAAWQQATT